MFSGDPSLGDGAPIMGIHYSDPNARRGSSVSSFVKSKVSGSHVTPTEGPVPKLDACQPRQFQMLSSLHGHFAWSVCNMGLQTVCLIP